ncbi:MAG: aminotransferase class V-fold PLP-dependent enzyme [Phenylobacterium sp.]|uniref:aminotransferase class V-fold PLP-dependent enzyme n=1 Tax=Phenylobacterium sp. TaxID=1871053 RepID=UPI003918CF26
MELDRRGLLAAGGAVVAASTALSACESGEARPRRRFRDAGAWRGVRDQFALSDRDIHMSAMLISSHPRIVREAIERHRRELDANPVRYLEANNGPRRAETLAAAARYLGMDGDDIALTDSTTMGIGLAYNALRLRPGQEILTTDEDYYVTHEAVRTAAGRAGASVRQIPLFDRVEAATPEDLARRVVGAVGPRTRVLALTWVHSSTGLKLPAAAIAQGLSEINAGRDEDDQVIFGLDAVHGFGNQDFDFPGLGCDILMAGCHKWLFGPRGTGILAASRRGWQAMRPIIPSFTDDGVFSAWLEQRDPQGATTASRMTPGGFKAFEHYWALAQAFEFHQEIGKARVARRTAELAGQLKAGLATLRGVSLRTPRPEALSAGIVSFDVDGHAPEAVVSRLRDRGVIGSVAPYATPHVRLTPSIRNTPGEVDAVLAEIREIAA